MNTKCKCAKQKVKCHNFEQRHGQLFKTTNKCSKIQTNEQTNKLTKNQNVENKKLNVNEIEQGTANVQNYKCSKYKWKNVKSEYVNRSSWICKKEKEMSMWIVKRWGDVSIKSS